MTRAKGRRVMSEIDLTGNTETEVDSDSDVESKEFFNVFDGTAGRPEGSYLDIQERVSAEKLRALQENREPKLDDPGSLPAATGTPMVPKERQVDNKYYSNPATVVLGDRDVDPVNELNVNTGSAAVNIDLSQAAQQARERRANEAALTGESDTSADVSDEGIVTSSDTTQTSSLSPEGNGGAVQY